MKLPQQACQRLPMIHIVISPISYAFCWNPFFGSAVNAYTSTSTNSCIASIVAYDKTNCYNGCYMRPPITIEFPHDTGRNKVRCTLDSTVSAALRLGETLNLTEFRLSVQGQYHKDIRNSYLSHQ